jgi:serine/threonine-protein kinase
MSSTQRPVLNDRYELQQRIGRGGMADVFVARDLLLDRLVAIKVLFPEFAADPNFVERFRREAQAAANLNHPNIVGVYDWGRYGSTYFMAMEFIAGRTLADVLRANTVIAPGQAADVAAEVAGALAFAHANGVVHRDVKPANILIGHDGRVKVADFGIARALNSATEQDLTQAGSVMGTATYFSPEQAQGGQPDPRSDLYSLGIVLYEMVAGKPPFTGENPVAIAYKQVHNAPQPLSELAPDVPRPFEAIVARLLAKNPANRYATADALRDDLRRFKEGLPVAALGGASGDDALGATRAMPAQPAPTVPMAAYPPQMRGADDMAPTQVSRTYTPTPAPGGGYEAPRRRSSGVIIVAAFVLAALVAGGVVLFNTLANRKPGGQPAASVSVPDVKGLTLEAAQKAITDAKLVAVAKAVVDTTAQPDTVYGQDPAANTIVDAGTTVTITYNPTPGSVIVTMPDVTTLAYADAVKKLVAAGFDAKNISQQNKVDTTATVGTVLEQSPIAGQQLPATTTIILIVATRPTTLVIPNVSGLDAATAAQQLSTLGVTVASTTQASDTVAVGLVIGTQPPIGNTVQFGSTVTLVVSSGSQSVTVPDLTKAGYSFAQASLALSSIGLKAANGGFVTLPEGDPRDATVVSQIPVGGTGATVPPGTVITLYVGKAATTTTTTSPATTTTTVAVVN